MARVSIIKGELDKAINYANAAVEEDYELYEKLQMDNMFVKIKDKINKPTEKIGRKINSPDRELEVFKHLESTGTLVGKLNNNDIQMIENISKLQEQNIDEEQKEK